MMQPASFMTREIHPVDVQGWMLVENVIDLCLHGVDSEVIIRQFLCPFGLLTLPGPLDPMVSKIYTTPIECR